ncbi:hypothetical protein [Litchfieldia alkalitelluris]|uniref:hypothetical protein n=1 Tax=Litchfieldia alkalitelluris TaxID=304268 RepID=UPI0009967DBC|nr:hypothetical protein [Litchfieldia alkalitelluris]
MENNKKIIYTGSLTGTISEEKENHSGKLEFGKHYIPIQETWEVEPVDSAHYDGVVGYKDL